jgi:excisionase family DNA binding protein
MATPIQLVISKRGDEGCPTSHDSSSDAQGLTPSTAVLTCILVFAKESEPILAILKKLTGDSPKGDQVSATLIRKIETPPEPNDLWLHHNEAADYLGISKSTLYRYAEQGHIESRKLGNRLEYRRSALDEFKNQNVRPARRTSHGRGIIAPAPVSGN